MPKTEIKYTEHCNIKMTKKQKKKAEKIGGNVSSGSRISIDAYNVNPNTLPSKKRRGAE